MKTRYLLEGRDEDGQWSWSNVSADGIKANATFDVRAMPSPRWKRSGVLRLRQERDPHHELETSTRGTSLDD